MKDGLAFDVIYMVFVGAFVLMGTGSFSLAFAAVLALFWLEPKR